MQKKNLNNITIALTLSNTVMMLNTKTTNYQEKFPVNSHQIYLAQEMISKLFPVY